MYDPDFGKLSPTRHNGAVVQPPGGQSWLPQAAIGQEGANQAGPEGWPASSSPAATMPGPFRSR